MNTLDVDGTKSESIIGCLGFFLNAARTFLYILDNIMQNVINIIEADNAAKNKTAKRIISILSPYPSWVVINFT